MTISTEFILLIDKMKKYKFFSHKKSFFQLLIVWFSFIIIILISIFLAYGISEDEKYIGCMSAICYKTFIESYKLPIGIMSLLIPVGALFAAQHRSEQYIAQIDKMENQNNFINYYKHLEEFNEYIKNNELLKDVSKVRKTHIALFRNIRKGDYEIQFTTVLRINSILVNIYDDIKDLENLELNDNNSDENNIHEICTLLQDSIKVLSNHLYLNINLDTVCVSIEPEENRNLDRTVILKNYHSLIKDLNQIINTLCEFDHSFDTPKIMDKLKTMSFKQDEHYYEGERLIQTPILK
ncbi:MAG: hypothetical protein HRT38_18665 [Alteromonadaceae bacterium]|nr:hypothetical protein [Alteromonadaceae bacterium]